MTYFSEYLRNFTYLVTANIMSNKGAITIITIFAIFFAGGLCVIFNIRSWLFVGIVVAVVLFAILGAAEITKLKRRWKYDKLPKQFTGMGSLTGKTLDEIVETVGPYSTHKNVTITDRNNAPGHFYIWANPIYFIKLLFDENNVCIGVPSEKYIKP